MSVLVSYIEDNYLDLIAKATLSILSIILLVLRSRASKKLKTSEELSAFLSWIPHAVRLANDLFPSHGQGAKRLNYVVEKCSSLFPSITLSTIVESVDQILNADKKGGDLCDETEQSTQEKGSKDLQQDCSFGQSEESSSASDARWHSSVDSLNTVVDDFFKNLSKLVDTQVDEPKKDLL